MSASVVDQFETGIRRAPALPGRAAEPAGAVALHLLDHRVGERQIAEPDQHLVSTTSGDLRQVAGSAL
jgi:hypothetical protein